MSLTTHAIFCYEAPGTLTRGLRAYVEGSIEKNEAVKILSSSRSTYEDLLKHLPEATLVRNRVGFIPIMELNCEKYRTFAESTVDEIKRLGYTGVRIFCLATEYFAYSSPQEVIKLEKQLGHNFSFPMSAICAYDTTAGMKDEILAELLQAHGGHIFERIAG